MLQIKLHHGAPAGRWIRLRELRGHDEAVLEPGDPWATTQLLGRLVVDGLGDHAFDSWALSVSDRDRIAAALYERLYGPRVESTIGCGACGEDMDIEFELQSIVREPVFDGLDEIDAGADSALEGGDAAELPRPRWLHESLGPLRAPTVRDQVELARWPDAERVVELARRCCPALADRAFDEDFAQELDAVLERFAPTLDVDLDTVCPECGAAQSIRFDLHAYLGASLQRERRFLMHEVHRLACAYGWPLGEIYSLRRGERRDFVRLVEREGRGVRR